jgi:glycosyltransferase involved in cell wall biosynthesis
MAERNNLSALVQICYQGIGGFIMAAPSDKIKNYGLKSESVDLGADELFNTILREQRLELGAEIGVAFGGHAETILKIPSVTKLYGVDPYICKPDRMDVINFSQEELNELYTFVITRLSEFGSRYEHIRKSDHQAVEDISDILDFVYLGTDCSYDSVWKDLCVWYGKVRDGGIVGGKNYDNPDFPGVKKAVGEFFRRFDAKINVEGQGIWWIEKQELHTSFFMPAYNCANTIQESIESIMDSNFSEGDELIIVNDASTDNTNVILNGLVKKYPQITVLAHKRNRGGGAARNTAIENAHNSILFCLDSDNILATDSIRSLKTFLINSGVDVAVFQELRYFTNGDSTKITHKWIFPTQEITLADCLSGPVVPGASGNYMFTLESWRRAGGYPEYNFLDTWGFGFRQLATGSKMAVLPETYYYHRYGHESYWVRETKKNNVSLLAIQILIPYLNLINDEDIDYVFSHKGRYMWFENLANRPLRVKEGTIGHTGKVVYLLGQSLGLSGTSFSALAKKIGWRIRMAFHKL